LVKIAIRGIEKDKFEIRHGLRVSMPDRIGHHRPRPAPQGH
jgi:hypothetical protein